MSSLPTYLQAFTFPNDVGFPIGGRHSPEYILLETHYDNPQLKGNDSIDKMNFPGRRAGLVPMQPMQLPWAPRHVVWVAYSFLPNTPCV